MVTHNVPSKWKAAPCSPPEVCPLFHGCPRCTSRRVRGRTCSMFRTIDIIESEIVCNYGLLTVTLPGIKDGQTIRQSELTEQFSYATKITKQRIGGIRYSTTMRGLPLKLQDSGVDGLIVGLEFTHRGGVNDNWNTHMHALCISSSQITIPESKKEIDPMDPLMEYIEIGEQNAWSHENLSSLGFGAQYQYTHIGGLTDVLREISKVTYGVKAEYNENGEIPMAVARDMQSLFKGSPRLMRKTGIARIPYDDYLRWAELNYEYDTGADYALNCDYDTRMINNMEDFMINEGYVKTDRYGDVIGKVKDNYGFNRSKSERFWWRRVC